MTILDNGTRDQYIATALQTVFAYTFEIFVKEDITVEKNGIALFEGTDYAVSGVGNENGGNVTLTFDATAGDIYTLFRDMELVRETDFQQSGDYLADDVNKDMDRSWAAIQQNETDLTRSIRAAISDSVLNSSNTELAAPSVRANKALGFDSKGLLDYLSQAAAVVGTLREYSSLTAAVTDIANITIGDILIVLARTVGKGGGATWQAVDATIVVENEFDIVTGNATVSLQLPISNSVSLAQLGIFPGASDNQAGFTRFAAISAPVKIFSDGEYNTSKQITFNQDEHIIFEGGFNIKGDLITVAGDAPEDAVLFFGGGGLTQIADLNANPEINKVDLSFAAAHNLSKGDYICLYNPTVGSWNAARDAYHEGEWCRVAEVVDSTNIKVAWLLFDGYAFGDLEVYILNSNTFSFSGNLNVSSTDQSLRIRPVRLENVVDTDISSFKLLVEKGHSALTVRMCVEITGVNLNCTNYGGLSSEDTYGISIGNSQHIYLDVNASGTKHGVTYGSSDEPGSVPNRDCVVGRVISHTGAGGTSLAANLHGNCEYCEFYGLILGGVNLGGDKNRVRGKVIANEKGIVVLASELRGFDHNFDGVQFNSEYDITPSNRGCFDIGGNSDAIDVDTVKGGLMNLANTTWNVPEVTENVINIVNRGAVPSEQLTVSIKGAKFIKTNAGLSNTLRIANVSGDDMDLVDIEGITVDQTQSITVIDTTIIKLFQQSGADTITASAVNNLQKAVVFGDEYPVAPIVTVTLGAATSGGGDRLLVYATAITKTGFTIDLRTADGNNFTGTATIDIFWQAG